MKKNSSLFFTILSCIYCFPLLALEPLQETPAPKPVGNFALPTSQQPAPLVSFGQTIMGKGISQLYFFADAFIGTDNYSTTIEPYFTYGIRNDLALTAYLPFSPGNKDGSSYSSGIEDIYGQIEYAFYAGEGAYFEDQATVVAAVAFPTGSSTKNPPTGAGSSSFFLGATFCRITYNWYFFGSPGFELTTYNHGTKLGNQLYYQCGIGRNIPSPAGWIFAAMVEFDGEYNWKNKIKGSLDPNSGSNIIYLTPSIWFSSNRFVLQFGAGYPIVQHLFGNQSKQFLSFNCNLGFTL